MCGFKSTTANIIYAVFWVCKTNQRGLARCDMYSKIENWLCECHKIISNCKHFDIQKVVEFSPTWMILGRQFQSSASNWVWLLYNFTIWVWRKCGLYSIEALKVVQYCRVPKNGLPKNGQAGISSKNKNYPRLEKWAKSGFTTRKQLLLWRRLLLRHCWLRNDSTSTFWNISAAFSTRHASSCTVCALQANLRDSKSGWKIRTILAGVVKNKNDPGWDRLPPVLRHPTVL